jgi:hypothetical protein
MKIKKLILMPGGITPGFILLEWRELGRSGMNE